MRIDIDSHIRELRETVMTAKLNQEIWWVYKNRETRRSHIDTMNKYSQFFQTSIHAHFVAMLLALNRLYETRRDTFNIPSLLCALKGQNAISETDLCRLKQVHEKSAKPLWIKVNRLRNNVFGHRSTAHKVEDVFKEAQLTFKELRQLIDVTEELLNDIGHAWNGSVCAFNLSARKDIIRLLDDLGKAT